MKIGKLKNVTLKNGFYSFTATRFLAADVS